MNELSDNERVDEHQVLTGAMDKADLSDDYIYEQAMVITKAGEDFGVPLRLIGATAFIFHSPKYNYLYKKSSRKLTDVDLMTYSKVPLDKLDAAFKSIGYEPIPSLGWHSSTRDIYVNSEKLYVDVFRDILSYCHPISFIGRLELDFPTIPLVDLLLEKVQIVQINAKDLFDVMILLLEHDYGKPGEPETVDIQRVLKLWSEDWGFYYTGTTNLKKVLTYIDEVKVLDQAETDLVKKRINYLIEEVENQPKTFKWKTRSLIGTKKRWYEEVESVER